MLAYEKRLEIFSVPISAEWEMCEPLKLSRSRRSKPIEGHQRYGKESQQRGSFIKALCYYTRDISPPPNPTTLYSLQSQWLSASPYLTPWQSLFNFEFQFHTWHFIWITNCKCSMTPRQCTSPQLFIVSENLTADMITKIISSAMTDKLPPIVSWNAFTLGYLLHVYVCIYLQVIIPFLHNIITI